MKKIEVFGDELRQTFWEGENEARLEGKLAVFVFRISEQDFHLFSKLGPKASRLEAEQSRVDIDHEIDEGIHDAASSGAMPTESPLLRP